MNIANNCKPPMSKNPKTIFVSGRCVTAPKDGSPREIVLPRKLFPIGSEWLPWTGSVVAIK